MFSHTGHESDQRPPLHQDHMRSYSQQQVSAHESEENDYGSEGLEDEADLEGMNRSLEVEHGVAGSARPRTSHSGSTDSMVEKQLDMSEDRPDSAKKKPRITLPRGRACVVCRNRKLKCTGETPCKTCQKAGLDCRYEELPRKKPRVVILEERVAELEALLALQTGQSGHRHAPPLVQEGVLSPPGRSDFPGGDQGFPFDSQYTPASSAGGSSTFPIQAHNIPPSVTLHSHQDLPTTHGASINSCRTEIAPNSPLEQALIRVVLPHARFIGLPVHPQRFLALLTLPTSHPDRPHPALLYILFAQAIRVLEIGIPTPRSPPAPTNGIPHSINTQPIPAPELSREYMLSQVGGSSVSLLEKARTYLQEGISGVEKSFDLVRASVGIAWYLYSTGRFIEGWNVCVTRLLISCGLHRITGSYISPDGSNGSNPELIPKPYAPAHQYPHSQSLVNPTSNRINLPTLRMRPIIIPPARDEIEVAERVNTFWAAKMQDWEAGIGWGWSISLVDELCTTEWGWGWGTPEPKAAASSRLRYGIRDLHDHSSGMYTSPSSDTTYTLTLKSLGLLHRASALYDLAESSHPVLQPDGRYCPTYIPPLTAVQAVETALQKFRQAIPPCFVDSSHTPGSLSPDWYDGLSDPWWIMFQSNLCTAEMLMWREMAQYNPGAYETAVGRARAMVGLVQRITDEMWAHLGLVMALNISLSSRFLFKEAARLRLANQLPAAEMASEEAEILRACLSGAYAKYMPMSSLHGLIVQRVREGWPEKEGEYERV
ncbi:hypothetical protein IAU60_002932 [Kwoniella sp. DSM 27419]